MLESDTLTKDLHVRIIFYKKKLRKVAEVQWSKLPFLSGLTRKLARIRSRSVLVVLNGKNDWIDN